MEQKGNISSQLLEDQPKQLKMKYKFNSQQEEKR